MVLVTGRVPHLLYLREEGGRKLGGRNDILRRMMRRMMRTMMSLLLGGCHTCYTWVKRVDESWGEGMTSWGGWWGGWWGRWCPCYWEGRATPTILLTCLSEPCGGSSFAGWEDSITLIHCDGLKAYRRNETTTYCTIQLDCPCKSRTGG